MCVLSIIPRININVGSVYFQNIYLSWIISQTNCCDDQLSSIDSNCYFICALVDIINAYFTLFNKIMRATRVVITKTVIIIIVTTMKRIIT